MLVQHALLKFLDFLLLFFILNYSCLKFIFNDFIISIILLIEYIFDY